MGENDFCTGFAAGFLVAGVIGFILQQIYLADKRSREASLRKVVVDIARSPNEIVQRSLSAKVTRFLLILLLVGAIAGLLWVLGNRIGG